MDRLMDKKYLSKYKEEKTRIKVNLKNGRFYTGIILSLEDNTILFLDKFNIEMPIDLDSISYVELAGGFDNGNWKHSSKRL